MSRARSPTLEALMARVVRCRLCPRLVTYREEVARAKKPAFAAETYWGRPVPSSGDPAARVLVVGLAPAAHGSNRTGRMFTGDGLDGMGAGDFLMRALHATGFASVPWSRHLGDGLLFTGLWLTAAVRCAPPGNRPSPAELSTCAAWLGQELDLLPTVRVVVGLGGTAFATVLRVLGQDGATLPRPRPRFGHGALVDLGPGRPRVLGCYHPSRQNTQTGRLTPRMLEEVFATARSLAQ